MDERPFFRYHPNYYSELKYETKYCTEIDPDTKQYVKFRPKDKYVCDCCGKESDVHEGGMYNEHDRYWVDVSSICPVCVANGAAARKFNGRFNLIDPDAVPSDPERSDEIQHRTPGILTYQWQEWPVCCDDYCIFLGHCLNEPVAKLNLSNEELHPYPDDEFQREYLCGVDGVMEWLMDGDDLLIFHCARCGKYYMLDDSD